MFFLRTAFRVPWNSNIIAIYSWYEWISDILFYVLLLSVRYSPLAAFKVRIWPHLFRQSCSQFQAHRFSIKCSSVKFVWTGFQASLQVNRRGLECYKNKEVFKLTIEKIMLKFKQSRELDTSILENLKNGHCYAVLLIALKIFILCKNRLFLKSCWGFLNYN